MGHRKRYCRKIHKQQPGSMAVTKLNRQLIFTVVSPIRYFATYLRRKPLRITKNDKVIYDSTSHGQVSKKIPQPEAEHQMYKGRPYKKLSDDDRSFGRLVTAAKSQKLRAESRVVLLEGKRLITDAILAKTQIKAIYFDKKEHLDGLPLEDTSCQLIKVKAKEMKLWSDVTTPPGILAICRMPEAGEDPASLDVEARLPVTVICDQIRDPGNMGTLIRTAAAASCRKVITTPGCVDIWDPKVIRSAMAAHFHISLLPLVPWYLLPNYFSEKTSFYIADNNPEPHSQVRDAPQEQIQRQSLFECEFVSGEDIAVIIGGETHGVSEEARRMVAMLSSDHPPNTVHIPMMSQIDSINSAVAASVILFEIKKQLRS